MIPGSLPSRRLVSQDDAAMIEAAGVPRSRFTGSWTRKTGFDAGYLVPFLLDEILPGDHMTYDVTAYVRLSTPLFPLFDNQRIDTFFFFVPNRLVWSNWQRFMGETDNLPGADPEVVALPTLVSPAGGFAEFSLFDHFGLPVAGQITAGQTISVQTLPLRAYNKIYNHWFRDENLQTRATEWTGNSGDTTASYPLQRRGKAHDYFTSALPWPQKFTAPTVPLGDTAPIIGLGAITTTANTGPLAVEENQGSASYDFFKNLWDATAINQVAMKMDHDVTGVPQVYADLSAATGVAINTLRQAWLIQGLLERDARGGTRYVELLKSHFGVTSPDFRLQRPEYIGGGSTPLNITPVAQTAPDATSVVGQLGAAGTAAGSHRASYAATEHGYIIGLINVRSELSYQQGLHKMWSRETRYDFYWPALAGLGEQSILREEIYCTGVDADDETVFGYQERWHEYRTRTSEVTGIMRSTATGTLDAWHLAQEFSSAPTLNSTFIQDTPPMDRVLAASTLAANQQYLADIMIQRNAVRPVPMYGTPVVLGRF